ncbi:MAG: response regulator [Verrucomicrobia bacterium]|nr:response regulator [Verrucomicrobiota bacterium]MBI3869194.1 response regulator [Verrucomicrobiota bacterium]
MQNHPIRVLLIEDNLAHARAIGEGLCANLYDRFDLVCTERLASGLEILGRGRIDLILLDLNLPDSAGLATFERFHRAAPQIPIVIMTGVDDPTLGQHAVASGAKDVLVKGQIEPSLLARVIQHIVEKQRMEAASRASSRSYGSVFDHALDAMLLVDDQARCLAANSAASRLLDRPFQKLRGSLLSETLITTDDWPQRWEGWRAQGLLEGQAQFVNADGRVGDLEFSITPDCIGSCHLVILRDVTARKRGEDRVKSACEQWRALAAGREESLNQLHKGWKELSSSIRRATQDLESCLSDAPSDVDKALRRRWESTLQSLRQTGRALDVATEDAEASRLTAIEALRTQARDFEKRTGIQCVLSSELREKSGGVSPATRLCPILERALSNVAIQGSATAIEVRLRRESGKLVMEIQDNGQSLSESQLTDARSSRLSGVREQVLRFGGDLTLQGAPGRGTTLRLWLPSESRKASRKQP